MKILASMSVMSLVVTGVGGPANAFSFNPKGVHFSVVGTVSLNGNENCVAIYKGKVNKNGSLEIRTATFKVGDAACSNVTATGLPWHGGAIGAGKGVLQNVGWVSTAPAFSCGPTSLTINVSGTGAVSYVLGACNSGGSGASRPAVTISNP